MISKGKVMSRILIFTFIKDVLRPFLINRVQGERTRTRKIDMELINYLDRLGGHKGLITKRAQDKVNK